MNKIKFNELTLSAEIHKAIKDLGFEEATPIQSLAIPAMLAGKDIIGQAQTGTGKTAAFGIPAIELIEPKTRGVQVLVMCPTRELAIQVSEQIGQLAKYRRDISAVPVYGGQPIVRQIQALKKGAQIVIGTPGRIMDHLERGTLVLGNVKLVVLDEADEMLDMGFRDDIETILKTVPTQRQTVLFSATFAKPIMDLAKRYQKHPETIKIPHDKINVPKIDQAYFEVREDMKVETLSRVLDVHDIHLALIFCNTKRRVDELVGQLQARGYAADGIHGDMVQSQRDRVMGKFRSGTTEILVATDVAARGIDVENVEAVVNFEVPGDEEAYVHRIGRTGRAGKEGRAFSFVSGREVYKLRDIQRFAKITIRRQQPPTLEDVAQMKAGVMLDLVAKQLEAGGLEKYAQMINRFVGEQHSSLDVAAALLKILMKPAVAPKAEKVAPTGASMEDTGAEAGYVRLFVSLGRSHGIKPGDLVGAIAGEVGLPGKAIGKINIQDHCSFVEVPEDQASKVISIMRTKQIKGRRVAIEPATAKNK
jgi:ATP-dependent RNA helicase DeaD